MYGGIILTGCWISLYGLRYDRGRVDGGGARTFYVDRYAKEIMTNSNVNRVDSLSIFVR